MHRIRSLLKLRLRLVEVGARLCAGGGGGVWLTSCGVFILFGQFNSLYKTMVTPWNSQIYIYGETKISICVV
jgi:hypothetical protein